MLILTLISCFFVSCCVVSGQQGPCNTANGGQGQCKSINNCPPLLTLVTKANRTPLESDILKRSHCGFDRLTPAVCCPGKNEPPPTPTPPCYTPDGLLGKCISLENCSTITNLMEPPMSPEKFEYVRNSRCAGPGQFSVCCGPTPLFSKDRSKSCRETVSAFPPDPSTECCGVDSTAGDKIFDGEETSVGQYPWMALIEYGQTFSSTIMTLCGGSLISGKYVLTAAHCVTGKILKRGSPLNIRLGEFDTRTEGPDCAAVAGFGEDCTSGAIRIPIESTIPHPQYNPNTVLHRHDVALIRMKEMAPFTFFIRPICLPTMDITLKNDRFNLTAAGWGAVSLKETSSPIKLHIKLPFVNKAVCQSAYNVKNRTIPLWKGQLCAGGVKGKDSCKGDSGGPLMYHSSDTFDVVGIVSFGLLECGKENVPAIYTNVYEYNSWIRNTLRP